MRVRQGARIAKGWRLGIALGVLSLGAAGLPGAISAPAGASTLGGIRSIASGADVSCTVLADTTARCWGFNYDGQLGDGTKTDRHSPTVVQNGNGTGPLTNVRQITVGTSHVCALITDGSARCWGEGGELGDGTNLPRLRPVIVKNVAGNGPLRTIRQINAGGHQTCASLIDGTARCWGIGGALGNGKRSSRLPVKVLNPAGTAPMTGVMQISVGEVHSCARISDGTARCWGVNDDGDLGDGTTSSRFLPVKVLNRTGLQTRITQIVASYYHSCARISDGTARCWGFNGNGQLGDGTRSNRLRAVAVLNRSGDGPLHGVTEITAGASHSCARLADGTARCWGKRLATGDANDHPSATNRLLPSQVMNATGSQPLKNIVQIDAGTGHTCVRMTGGTAGCFGENAEGELGDGTTTASHFVVWVG